ncbi:MAG: uroporphyrinogen decarboxylase family protein [Lentisphaeria bacterium]|jgi:uroporphyrinogen-III decarboxylase
MNRDYYLKLAQAGLRFPVGADLVLQEHPDHEEILRDGARLGAVVAEAARRFKTPLACPVMDLMLEKALMLHALGGIAEADIPTWHFHACPTAAEIARIRQGIQGPLDPRLQANVDAVRHIAQHHPDLVPVGMSIGPFSLMTKLLAEPITPVYLAGAGLTGEDEPEVKTVETVLELAVAVISRSFQAQAAAGAKLFFVAEPAANKVYISPNQMAEGSDVFERMALKYMRRLKAQMDAAGVDLLFHCCGELVDEMVRGFASLRPAILSLGSSRQLWEDAALVPKDIVLYGNLPSKKFYSDDLITVAGVETMSREFLAKMKATGHPYILGTECDVLSVKGCERQLLAKAMAVVEGG